MKFMRAQTIDRPTEPPDEPPPRSAEREALAAAIEARSDAEQIVGEARAAIAKAGDKVAEVRIAFRTARSRAIELGEAGADRFEISAAIAGEAGLARDLATAKAGLTILEDGAQPIERVFKGATVRAEIAARAVIAAGAAERLLAAAEAREAYVTKLAALLAIESAIDAFSAGELAAEIRGALARAKHEDLAEIARRSPAAAGWRASLAGLILDPDCRLPPD